MTTRQAYYRQQRAIGWPARQALSNAKTHEAWDELDGEIVNEFVSDEPGTVRLKIVAEQEIYDDSFIDTWDDSLTTVGYTQMTKEQYRSWLHDKIERDGVWGMIGEFWNGQEWEHADSCFGFIGEEWRNSGYDSDIMQAAIDAYNATLTAQARQFETERPDMYNLPH